MDPPFINYFSQLWLFNPVKGPEIPGLFPFWAFARSTPWIKDPLSFNPWKQEPRFQDHGFFMDDRFTEDRMPRQARNTRLQLETLEVRTNPSAGVDGIVTGTSPLNSEVVVTKRDDQVQEPAPTETAFQTPMESTTGAGNSDHHLATPVDAPTALNDSSPGADSSQTFPETNFPTTDTGPVAIITALKNENTLNENSEPFSDEHGVNGSETVPFSFTTNSETTTPDPTLLRDQGNGSNPAKTTESTEETSQGDPLLVPLNTDAIQTLGSSSTGIESPPIIPKPLSISEAELKRLIEGFLSSREFARNQVEVTFLKYLGRLPEKTGLDHWTNHIVNGHLNNNQLISLFVSSPEYLKNMGYNAHSIFQDLYQNSLGREADEKGLDDWTRNLFLSVGKKLGINKEDILALYRSDKNGIANQAFMINGVFQQTLRQSVDSFLNSHEFHRNVIETAYGGILDRHASEVEIQEWAQFLSQGHGEEKLLGQFLQSKEYRSQYHSHRALVTGLYGDILFRSPDANGFLGWCGTVGPDGKFHSTFDSELNEHYQQILVYAQTQMMAPENLLQEELDEAFAYRVEKIKPENLEFISEKHAGFTL